MKPVILHLHCFKCAGTTFTWILERCFPDKVLYLESRRHDERLDWRRTRALAPWRESWALTSHLIDCPPRGALAELVVSFFRHPVARLHSAFRFVRDKQARIPQDATFQDFVTSRNPIMANFMTRHLSPQAPSDWRRTRGWALRPEAIDFVRDDLLVGTVERFDESLVVLEQRLAQRGQVLDLSYPAPFNARPVVAATPSDLALGEEDEWLRSWIARDLETLGRVNEALSDACARVPDFPAKLLAFRQRCAALRGDPGLTAGVRVKPAGSWYYL